MPELPEVEVIRRGLAPRLVGRRFLQLTRGNKSLRRQSSPAELERWVAGRRLKALKRQGKYLIFTFEGGGRLVIHLGMTGRLLLTPLPSPQPPHVHLIFHLEGGLTLAYQDVRRFGQILVFPPGAPLTPLAQVGAEPFSRKVTADWLAAQARGKSRPIKNLLLDGRILAGLGNIYACETLYAAGIHPATPTGKLSPDDWTRLLQEARRILKRAIAKGGTTINNYLDSKGESGLFQVELLVYGRTGELCGRCKTPIARLVLAGRSTFYCPRCQPEKQE